MQSEQIKKRFYAQSVQDYADLFGGHKFPTFVGQNQQAGSGVILDLLKEWALPALKHLAPHLLTMGSRVVKDVTQRKTPVKTALKRRAKQTARKVLAGKGRAKLPLAARRQRGPKIVRSRKKQATVKRKKRARKTVKFPILS